MRLVVKPRDLGWRMRRDRVFDIVRDVRKTRLLRNPQEIWSAVKRAFHNIEAPPGHFLVATEAEIQHFKNKWVQRRKHRCNCQAPNCSCSWRDLLAPGQQQYLELYETAWTERGWDIRGAIFHLGDNPNRRLVWSGACGDCPTLRKAMTLLWSGELGRQILPQELLAGLGWTAPQARELSASMGQAGNAMHIASVGAAAAVALSCIASL